MTMSNSEARKRFADIKSLQEEAEDELFTVRQERALLKEKYHAALAKGAEAGMSNRKMGEIVGVSEAAIRMYRKRNGL